MGAQLLLSHRTLGARALILHETVEPRALDLSARPSDSCPRAVADADGCRGPVAVPMKDALGR